MFTFQFDAPKYKCFGGNQPRRSTITAIDNKNPNDRWFLNFSRPSCWEQLFKNILEEKCKAKSKSKSQNIHQTLLQNKQNNLEQQTNNNNEEQQHQSNQSKKEEQSNIIQNNQPPINQQKQLSKNKSIIIKKSDTNHQKPIINNKKPIIQNKKPIINNKKPSKNKVIPNKQTHNLIKDQKIQQVLIKKPFLKKKEKQTIKPINHPHENKKSLQSLDTKPQKQSKKSKNSKVIQIKKDSKGSKSLPSSKSSKMSDDIPFKIPCLYPIRIQRQWQQFHNINWYDLQASQILKAQQSMKKRMNTRSEAMASKFINRRHKPQQNSRQSKIKITNVNPNQTKKFVNNPLYENENKANQDEIQNNENQDENQNNEKKDESK